jgi:hypothetical protein
MRKEQDEFQTIGQNGIGPLSNPNAFIQYVFPMVSPYVQAAVDTLLQGIGKKAVPNAPYTVKRQMPEINGNNHTAFLAQMDNRPVMVIRKNDTGEHYVVPMEQLRSPLHFIFGPGVRSLFTEKQPSSSGAVPSVQLPPTGSAPPTGGQTHPEQQQPQQQQQSMNLFEYMSKLPPNERMLYTLLIYILLSDAISSVFRRGRGGAQPATQQVSTGWMPGSPRGSQWMIWG